MTLDDYMRCRSIRTTDAAAALDVSIETIRLWRKGERRPRPDAMARIHAWSEGAVGPADFYPDLARSAAE